MTSSTLPPPYQPATGRAFNLTLAVAAIVHLLLIATIGFKPTELPQQSRGLEVTLATYATHQAPEKADFIAQDNQEGSGTLEEVATPTTPEESLFQATEIAEVSLDSSPEPVEVQETPQPVLSTTRQQPQQVVQQPRKEPEPEPVRKSQVLDQSKLAADIASLEAEFAIARQEYTKRPRVSRQNTASTKRDISAQYRDDWRKKAERIGNMNYPAEARSKGLYGSLRLLVVIRSDGQIHEMKITSSSGQPVLDEAAQKTVRLSAPFPPFPAELASVYDQIEIIRTWSFEQGNRLYSH